MKKYLNLSYPLVIVPLMIFCLGFITLLSSSKQRAITQLLFFIIGSAVYVLFTKVNYKILMFFWKYIYGGTIVLLGIVYLIGITKLGSVRWINLGLFTLQPSELAKITVIVCMSAYISLTPDFKTNIKKQLILTLMLLPIVLMVFFQPDLGSTIIISGIVFFILFFSGISKKYFLIAFILMGMLSNPLWHSLKDYQKIRILVFLNPQLDLLGHGYNVTQSIISVGSGGLWGKGFSKGTQAQMEFLPVHWTDFIFASFSEEWGFVGVTALIILYTVLLACLLKILLSIKDPYGSLFITGVFSVLFSQLIINVGMNMGLLPVTGITLPLVSYGGSSLISTMALIGMTQNVYMNTKG